MKIADPLQKVKYGVNFKNIGEEITAVRHPRVGDLLTQVGKGKEEAAKLK